jgi:translation initiation factor eIF-2B subunit delta
VELAYRFATLQFESTNQETIACLRALQQFLLDFRHVKDLNRELANEWQHVVHFVN